MPRKKKKDKHTNNASEEQQLDEVQSNEANNENASMEKGDKKRDNPESEAEKLNERILRLQADFENFRKRVDRERDDVRKTAARDFIEELLPALDNFELGMKAARGEKVPESVVSGFQLVYDQMQDLLQRSGVEPIDAEGEQFDPNIHDCISCLPSIDHPENTVMTQTRRGYTIHDNLLRPAQVVVSGGSPDAPPTEEPCVAAAPMEASEDAGEAGVDDSGWKKVEINRE